MNVFGRQTVSDRSLLTFGRPGSRKHIVSTASMSGLRPSRASLVYIALKYASARLAEGARREFRDTAIGFSLLFSDAFVTDLANTSARSRDLRYETISPTASLTQNCGPR
jgi:NADP-dependent 3-hydroxy acid dehydrogenase YdfG